MPTRAIKRKRDEDLPPRDFQTPRETAPSIVRTDEPFGARVIAMMALLALTVGAFALILAAVGREALVGPGMSDAFLLGQGVVLLLLGLFYLAAFVGLQPPASDHAYRAGIGLGVLGGLMMFIPIARMFLPSWFGWIRWTPGQAGPPVLF